MSYLPEIVPFSLLQRLPSRHFHDRYYLICRTTAFWVDYCMSYIYQVATLYYL